MHCAGDHQSTVAVKQVPADNEDDDDDNDEKMIETGTQ